MTPSATSVTEQDHEQHETSSPERKILFVDDEREILDGLRRRIRLKNPGWVMAFESDPYDALTLLEHEPFDALVTDLRMPNITGEELLAHAIAVRPEMLRIVLSGQSERNISIRAATLAHRVLAKPTNTDRISQALAHSFRLRKLIPDAPLRKSIGGLSALPVSTKHQAALRCELARADVSTARIAHIVEQDLAMAARVLQLADSAFFGQRARYTCIQRAIANLGLDVMEELAASEITFDGMEDDDPASSVSGNHHLLTAMLAARIAELTTADPSVIANAWQAGMLHDIGMLILKTLLRTTSTTSSAVHEVHGPAGGYLVGLWGFGDAIVDAVTYHHHPRDCPDTSSAVLAAVHVADALLHERFSGATECEFLDIPYLTALGLDRETDSWRAEACRLTGQSTALETDQ